MRILSECFGNIDFLSYTVREDVFAGLSRIDTPRLSESNPHYYVVGIGRNDTP